MGNESLLKNPKTSLLASSSVLFASAFIDICSGGTAITLPLIATAGFGILKDVAPEFFGASFQETFLKNVSEDEILKNGDLRRAVGKAVFVLILDESSKPEYETFGKIIKTVGNSSLKVWESYIDKKFSEENARTDAAATDLEKILPNQLTPYFAKKENELDKVTALTPESWSVIVKELFQHETYYPSDENCLRIGERLHRDFAKVLRKVLIDDFSRDGKAYASMQLRISSEMLAFVVEIKKGNDEIKAEILELKNNFKEISTNFLKDLKPSDDTFWQEVIEAQQTLVQIQTESLEVQKESRDYLKIIAEKDNPPPKQSKIPTKLPVSRFPMRLNFFTGRGNVLEGIEDSLKLKHTAALFGIHGLGKSSVVTEFAYLNEENYEHIFFIRAVGADFDIFIGEIVSDLQIPTDEQTTPAQKLGMFQHWLAENDNWLLILDNVDDVSAINDCNFTAFGGDVVFTSNDEAVWQIGNRVEVPNMDAEEAASLLFQHWKGIKVEKFDEIPAEKHEALLQIAEMFGRSPLAMTFIGVYLAVEDESLDEFLETYHDKQQNLLARYKFLSNYQHAEVAAPFLLAFEAISQPKDDSEREILIAEAVKDYLKFSAFLAPDNIPEDFLMQCFKKLHAEKAEIFESKNFFRDVRKRFTKSPIFTRDGDTKTFTTHRIVQEVIRFKIEDEENRLIEIISETLNENVPTFDYTNREKVEPYLAHLENFIEYLINSKENSTDVTKFDNQTTNVLSYKIGSYNHDFGQYNKAEKYYSICRDICEKIYGKEHQETATSYNNLGLVYFSQGDYPKAEKNHLDALRIKLNIFGENHPDTASSYGNLGTVYDSQGDYPKAEKNHLDTLQIYLNIFGENHPLTAASYNNLGTVYHSQGDYPKAEKNHLDALRIRLNIFGENHPDTAASYNNLGAVYYSQGDYLKAEKNHLDALRIRLNIFGENHPDTAKSYNNLGAVYYSQGNYPKAEKNHLDALRIKLNILGENHPLTATSYNNLGLVYENQDKLTEAKTYYKKASENLLRFLPENHPSIQTVNNNLERVREKLGK